MVVAESVVPVGMVEVEMELEMEVAQAEVARVMGMACNDIYHNTNILCKYATTRNKHSSSEVAHLVCGHMQHV